MSIKVLSLTFLVIFLVSSTFASKPAKLQVYVESLCPDTINFEVNQLKKLIKSDNRDELASSIEIIPFGNAKETTTQEQDNKSLKRTFECQHGEKECYGNKLQNCAFKYTSFTEAFEYTFCFSKLVKDVGRDNADLNKITQACSFKYEKLIYCANSTEGDDLLHEAGLKTKEHNYIPYIIIDDKHTPEIQSLAEFNLIDFLCKYNDLVNKIPACQGKAFLKN